MALSRLDYTLIHLMEEASEVQKAAAKALRFGIDNIDSETGKTNRQRLAEELHDVESTKQILETRFQLPLVSIGFTESQWTKGEKMFEYAVSIGRVEPF